MGFFIRTLVQFSFKSQILSFQGASVQTVHDDMCTNLIFEF